MDTLSFKTKSARPSTITRNWYVADAKGQTLGRFCSRIASVIRGKHKASFTPHMDCGDYVVVINASDVKLTGRKMTRKEYKRYSGYPGGQIISTPREILATKPASLIEMSVRGMLPKNKLGDAMYRKLFVYTGAEHPHAAQKPQAFKLNSR